MNSKKMKTSKQENAEPENAVATSTATEPAQPKRASSLEVVQTELPEVVGLVRKIHPLWNTHFRVNFHDPNEGNKIVSSYFVSVEGGEAVVVKESGAKPREIE